MSKLPGLGGRLGPDEGPIQAEYHALMTALADVLDDTLNPGRKPDEARTTGFFLAVFPMSEANDSAPPAGRFNYLSNADRLDVRAMLKEIVARIEARLGPAGRA